ncbi:MAG: elongation factor Ts [Betaproteobacteria bacterium]|jgi:elongation factor Ts|nr:elongation factor Ts [Betaproteobacteria bacterium]
MAEVTAALVKELREMTGLGMMECKKALQESDGNIGKAEEFLRIRSGAKASKAAGRVAAEGVIGVYISADGKLGALVEVNCETDFVARNDDFLTFANGLAELVASHIPADPAALSELSMDGTTVEARRQALVQKIGENISVRRFQRIAAKGGLTQYLHGAKIGVLVDFEGPVDAGKDVAMHIAFSKPRYMKKDDVPADATEKEREILKARAAESGKPAEIIAKMIEGGINKYLAEISLLGQPFVKDDKQTVEKMLAGRKATLHGYAFFVVGEGIEKKSADFAAEVASMAR